jgi:hypothetical protein
MKKSKNSHSSKACKNEQSSENNRCSKENSLEAIELPSADCHRNLSIFMIAAEQTVSRERGHDQP